jgi:hypothetical protein
MSKKLLYDVNVPVLATIRFNTMATSILEAKADVCRRLAETDVQSQMFAYWEHTLDEPEFEVQWDSVSAWLSPKYHANVAAGSAEGLTEEEMNQGILYPPGDPNARTDRERRITTMLNQSIMETNNDFLMIANKIMEKDFEWLLEFAYRTIEASKRPDWNEPKNKSLDE